MKMVAVLHTQHGAQARLARAGPFDVEIVLAAPIERPRWSLTSSTAMSVQARRSTVAELGPAPHTAAIPLLVPIGEDERGSWVAILQPGSSLALLGSGAPALFSTLAAAASRPPVSHQLHCEQVPSGWVLTWSVDHATETARVTSSASEPADTTIVVDHRGLTVHPDGLVLTGRGNERPLAPQPGCPATSNGPDPFTPGDIEVRLLTAVPRLDGLQAELPANRARRAIELVAYLAIHHPDPVSSDRLRTRVLGSPDADAASKTLFNTIAAARKALGHAPNGDPYLPNGSRHGRYSLSPRVTVDVLRALQLFVDAKSAEAPDLALALYRSGFELIEGEPLAGSLSGYGWWRSEGHEARLSSATVAAAGGAIRLSLEQRLFDLGWWILDKARLVEPFSEALSRAAMTIAAAAGDQARLRKEWDDCCRRVTELDPGASPSVETVSLYRQLSRR